MKYYVIYKIWGDYNIPILNDIYFAGVKHEKIYWNISRSKFNSAQTANPINIDDILGSELKSTLISYLFSTPRVEDILHEA